MSEVLPGGHEKHEAIIDLRELDEKLKEHSEKAKSAEHEPQKELAGIQSRIEQQAVSGREISLGQAESTNDNNQYYANKQLKAGAFERTLRAARKHLTPSEKALSKVIHQPAVDSISRFGEKTVGRPSGLLGGSLAALLGSVTLLYLSKHYGFHYNYLMFVLLFVGGFVVGMIIELLLAVLLRSRRAHR